MSKNRIAILILIVGFAAMIAYFAGQKILSYTDTSKPVDVEVARPITDTVVKPDPSVFNDDAINPTVRITIGENNQDPIGQ